MAPTASWLDWWSKRKFTAKNSWGWGWETLRVANGGKLVQVRVPHNTSLVKSHG
ncbi:hypothetical protein BDZ91DRAFT_737684 [Kalaharituber pfeilii]|nr:hypothetical protein BDZ91DRAFT_737684 [Kalaharituber pfeilii]